MAKINHHYDNLFHMRKLFTLEERKKIEKYVKLGCSCREISRYLNRSSTGIIQEVNKNGGVDNYNALNAQRRFEECDKQRIEKIKFSYEWPPETEKQIIDLILQGESINYVSQKFQVNRDRLQKILVLKNIPYNSKQSLMQRIEVLEDQIKLMSELIKEIYESSSANK